MTDSLEESLLQKRFSVLITTWFYTGFIPPIPPLKGMAGTWGSLFAIPLCYLMLWQERILIIENSTSESLTLFLIITIYMIVIALITVTTMCVIGTAEREIGPRKDWKGKIKTRDQNEIVIDEVVGMLIATIPMLFIAQDLTSLEGISIMILTFILFRVFDIVKIQPTKYFDKMKNEVGIMMDDIIAGIQTATVSGLLIWLFL